MLPVRQRGSRDRTAGVGVMALREMFVREARFLREEISTRGTTLRLGLDPEVQRIEVYCIEAQRLGRVVERCLKSGFHVFHRTPVYPIRDHGSGGGIRPENKNQKNESPRRGHGGEGGVYVSGASGNLLFSIALYEGGKGHSQPADARAFPLSTGLYRGIRRQIAATHIYFLPLRAVSKCNLSTQTLNLVGLTADLVSHKFSLSGLII